MVIEIFLPRNQLSLSNILSFLELPTSTTFLCPTFSSDSLDKHIDLGIGVLPVTNIELAYFATAAIDY